MRRPERLLDQYFGKAVSESLRGCGGWPLQPHPVDLEPPWDEFDRRDINLWDCMVHGWEAPWEGSILKRAFSPDKPIWRQGQEIVLPPLEIYSSDGLVPINIEQFPEDESTIPKAQELLRSLPELSRPVAFELFGVGKQPKYDTAKAIEIVKDESKQRSIDEAICGWYDPYIVTRFVAHRDDARRLERQLLAHYPNSAVVLGDQVPDDGPMIGDVVNGEAYGAALGLEFTWCAPLRIFGRLDPDPLGVAIAAMEDLDRSEWALIQILFQQAERPWAETLKEALADPYNDKQLLLNDIDPKWFREKFTSPLFVVSIRILSSRQDVYRQLGGWAEQFAQPPQRFEPLIEDGEALQLGQAVDWRCTYRPGMLLNADELASLVHLPGRSVVTERLRQVKYRTRPAIETPPEPASVYIGENIHRGKRRRAVVPANLRARHCYVAGASGTGKSTLLLNMILQDIESGQGVGVLDPHGDLITDVLRRIPESRIDDVILFDPTDKEYPFALNILDARDEDERERIVAETLMALEKYFPAGWGARLERILTFTLLTVLETVPNATLADVERALTDRKFREQAILKCKTRRYVEFWNNEFGFLPKNAIDPVLNKLSVFLLNKTVRNIICQRHTAINFDRVLNDGKILLANLSTGILTEKFAGMFGTFLVTKIVNAAFRRAAIPEEQRRPWYLYVDEFQAFMNLSVGFDRILSEARKYKLVLAGLANQYVGQLSQEVRQAIFGNVGTMIVFRLGVSDAGTVEKELGKFTAEEIFNLGVGEALVRAGRADSTFNVATPPPPEPPEVDPTRTIVAATRERYARPRQAVLKMLGVDDGDAEGAAPSPDEPKGKRRRRRRKSPDDQHPMDPSEDDFVH